MNHHMNRVTDVNGPRLQKRKRGHFDVYILQGPSSRVMNGHGPSRKIPCLQHPEKTQERDKEKTKKDFRKIKSSGDVSIKQQKGTTDERKKQGLVQHWEMRNVKDFPRIHDSPCIIPPLSFYRLISTRVQIGQAVIHILTPSKQLSDIRESEAENRVVRAFTTLLRTGQHGAMAVVRNIVFDNYLNFSGRFPSRKLSTEHVGNSSGATESAETETYVSDDVLPEGFSQSDYGLFPRPRDQSSELQRGSFDILIISKKYGLIICETKAVGDTFGAAPEGTTKQFEHESITKRISKALKQLDKESRVLAYLVSDVDPQLTSCRVLVLPNLSKDTLRDVLKVEHKLRQEFCRCMDADNLDMALKKCIFSQHLPPIGKALEADDSINDNLKQWWEAVTAGRTGHEMGNEIYKALLARFCGPATSLHVPTASQPRADVRTHHNAVHETWRCMKMDTLYPEQFQFLQSKEERVFLTGPPGTGKTTLLKFKGIQWSSEGHVVYVISLWTGSEAVSYSICEEIKRHLPAQKDNNDNVRLLLNRRPKFKDVLDPLIKHLMDLTEKGAKNCRLHLIIDEATWYLGLFIQTLERKLRGSGLAQYSLWAASIFHGFKPKPLKEFKMTRSLRCPPAVVREIQKGGAYAMRAVYPYPDMDAGVLSSQPPPTDGPPVKRIEHHPDHNGDDVWDCEVCGEELARVLKDDLQIGSVTSQDRLKFSHVFVSGHVRLPPPGALAGFLKGLSVTGGVPYDVISNEDGFHTEKLAHPTDDKVQLVLPECLVGLERPVVVYIGTNDLNATNPNYVDPWCDVVSRCQAQLVVVEDVDVSMVRGLDRLTVN